MASFILLCVSIKCVGRSSVELINFISTMLYGMSPCAMHSSTVSWNFQEIFKSVRRALPLNIFQTVVCCLRINSRTLVSSFRSPYASCAALNSCGWNELFKFLMIHHHTWNSKVTELQAGLPRNRGYILGGDSVQAGVMLTTHLHLMSTLRMRGSTIRPLLRTSSYRGP